MAIERKVRSEGLDARTEVEAGRRARSWSEHHGLRIGIESAVALAGYFLAGPWGAVAPVLISEMIAATSRYFHRLDVEREARFHEMAGRLLAQGRAKKLESPREAAPPRVPTPDEALLAELREFSIDFGTEYQTNGLCVFALWGEFLLRPMTAYEWSTQMICDVASHGFEEFRKRRERGLFSEPNAHFTHDEWEVLRERTQEFIEWLELRSLVEPERTGSVLYSLTERGKSIAVQAKRAIGEPDIPRRGTDGVFGIGRRLLRRYRDGNAEAHG